MATITITLLATTNISALGNTSGVGLKYTKN